MSEQSEPDAHTWAMDLGPVYPGGPDQPIGAHLIVRSYDGGSVWGEVHVAECGKEFTATSHPRGWWTTRRGHLPLQDHAIHCGASVSTQERKP